MTSYSPKRRECFGLLNDGSAKHAPDSFFTTLSEAERLKLNGDKIIHFIEYDASREKALEEFILAVVRKNNHDKEYFHENTCLKTMGCHCKPTSLDQALEKLHEAIK